MFDAERLGNSLLPDFKIGKRFSRDGQQALVISRLVIYSKNLMEGKERMEKVLVTVATAHGPRSHDSLESQPLFRWGRSQLEPESAGGNRHLVKPAVHRALGDGILRPKNTPLLQSDPKTSAPSLFWDQIVQDSRQPNYPPQRFPR